MAHSCPNCEQACYCDGEDVWLDSNADDCIQPQQFERDSGTHEVDVVGLLLLPDEPEADQCER